MRSDETLRWVAAAKPREPVHHGRYDQLEQRRLLLATILAEDRHEVPDHAPGRRVLPLARRRQHRQRLAAVVGAGALAAVLVAVFVVGSPAPTARRLSLPTIVIEQPSLGAIGLPEPVYPYLMSLTAGSGLSSASGSEPVYRVSWPMTQRSSAILLAHVFGVTGRQTDFVEGGSTFGPPAGPAVEVTTEAGILSWTYVASPAVRCPLIGRTTCAASGGAPSDSWATRRTLRYLASLGLASDLGRPYLSDFRGQVGVNIPIKLGGLEANEQFSFIFGPGDTLEMATGVFGDYRLVGNYPTMSATSAVGALQSEPHQAPRAFLTDCPANGQGTPVCSGTITSANLGFRHAATSAGELLIPQWFMQGPMVGGNPDAKTIGGVVPALEPLYVRNETQSNR